MIKRYSRRTSNTFIHISIIIGLSLSTLLASNLANAVPAFARQTDMPCVSCHYQSFPALNTFGRIFRANGYIMTGSQKKIEGDDISMPSTLNASIITKIRYQYKGDDNRGEVQWPDEAAILVGGRLSEDTGFLMELGMGPQGADTGTGTFVDANNDGFVDGDTNNDGIKDVGETWLVDTGSGDADGNFLSTKFHFNVTDSLAVVPFSTDGLGVGYGFELLNTGVQRSQRPIENRKGFGAAQMLGTASGGATGIAFAYHEADLFVNYSHWAPTWGNIHANVLGGMAHYLRAAYMPNIGGWDTGIGFSVMSGTIDTGAVDPATVIMVDSWGIDAQAQGAVGDMPLGVYLSYGVAPKSTGTGENENFYNASTLDDSKAMGLLAKLGVIPGKTQVYVAYGTHDFDEDPTGTPKMVSVTDITFGIQQMLAQNIKLELYHVDSDSVAARKDYTMLMFFAGF